jgi:hypothetical protein
MTSSSRTTYFQPPRAPMAVLIAHLRRLWTAALPV